MILKKDPDILKSYLEDSSNLSGGHADEVAVPENIEELSAFLKKANSAKLPVTVSGGGTSTTGSRIPFGGVVLSLEKLNKIIKVSGADMSATLQAGVTVDELKKAADKEGLFYTSHPTEGAAFVGGSVSTNASGARSFKYGPTRNYVRRLKMVLADGTILDIKRGQARLWREDSNITLPNGRKIHIPMPSYKMPDVKSAAGYFVKDGMDLIDLFIGQEGTLSVIAEMEIGLVKKPFRIISSFVFFRREEDAWGFASEARRISLENRGSKASAGVDALSIEYFDSNALALLDKKYGNVPKGARSAIFFEQEMSKDGEEDIVLDGWLRLISKHGSDPDNTWFAMNDTDTAKFSNFRYAIPEAVNEIVRQRGFHKFSTDIAVPEEKFPEMMRIYKDTLEKEKFDHVIFGHISENHVHVNILPVTEEEMKRASQTALFFIKKGVSFGGTVSAEHGIGKIKHRYLEEMYGTSGVLEMSKVKRALDPNCILGRDNIFPKELLAAE